MITDIAISLTMSVMEAIGANLTERKQALKIQKEINEVIENKFSDFADTSLDCGDFYAFIKGSKFVDICKKLFSNYKRRSDLLRIS